VVFFAIPRNGKPNNCCKVVHRKCRVAEKEEPRALIAAVFPDVYIAQRGKYFLHFAVGKMIILL
jgi:hypothetical protein